MTVMEMPYFMTNEEWFETIWDEEGNAEYKIKPSAPPKAKESYKQYLKEMDELGIKE